MTLEPIPSADSPVLKEIVRRAVEVAHPLKIYLFGSVARGEAGPDSDYDLMLVVPDDTPEERRRGGYIYQALRGLDPSASVDIVIYRKSKFEKQAARVVASLPAAVIREGRLLYAA
jgi:predicted nucleotidyltransferase